MDGRIEMHKEGFEYYRKNNYHKKLLNVKLRFTGEKNGPVNVKRDEYVTRNQLNVENGNGPNVFS